MDSNSEAASIPTYAVVDMTKKNSHAAKKKHQPEILSDIPMYSEVNRESESTGPWSESTAFDNQMYSGSMATIENVHSMLNKTAIKVAVEEPIALQENPSETNTKVKKISSSHSKKNQCDKTVACILVTITLLIFVIVVALTIAIAAFVLISQLNSELASIRKSTSLSNQEALALTNSSIQMIEMRFSQDLSMIESQTMALIQNYTERSGLYQNYPAASCGAILQFVPSSPSGHYWIRSSDGSAVHVYCDMTRSCGGVTGGWMRVAELDMRDSGSQCPSDLRMGTACNPTRTCMIDTNDAGCSSISFTAHNFNYSRVCGMIRAYQVGTPDAFGIFGTRPDPPTLDSNYVDGISLTYGTFPIQHIWTLAAEAGIKSCTL